jgi:hypothetical protein
MRARVQYNNIIFIHFIIFWNVFMYKYAHCGHTAQFGQFVKLALLNIKIYLCKKINLHIIYPDGSMENN